MRSRSPRIAIIGCGAVTENIHLPTLSKNGLRPALLVDKNLARAERLASRFNVPQISDDYQTSRPEFNAAIVALPHHLHGLVSTELLNEGVDLLVEKPMAMTVAEAQGMIAAAKESQAVLSVGLSRHFLDVARWVKAAIEANVLGKIVSFEFQEGNIYRWPVASDFMFRREMGGGVLFDTGVHTLDLLLWWLGDVADYAYWDDSHGGVEANCEIHLTTVSGASGVVELSRTRSLPNTAIIKGTKGELEVSLSGRSIQANPNDLLKFKTGNLSGTRLRTRKLDRRFTMQVQDWLNAIETRSEPEVSGEQGLRSIALIEALRERRQTLEEPWSKVTELQRVTEQVGRV